MCGTYNIEEIDNYNLYVKNMVNLQMSQNSMMKQSVTSGMKYEPITKTSISTADATNSTDVVVLANSLKTTLNNGVATQYTNNGLYMTANAPKTFTITLASILGSLSSVYIPLFKLKTQLRVEITLVNGAQFAGAFPSTITGFTIDRPEYIASLTVLPKESIDMIEEEVGAGGNFILSAIGVKNNNGTQLLKAGSNTSYNFQVMNAGLTSVKSVLVNVRNDATVGIDLYYPLSTHHFNLVNYQFKLGSVTAPPSPPDSIAQYFVELQKCTGSYADTTHAGLISYSTYDSYVPTINTTTTLTTGSISSGNFMIGMDTERYCSSDKESIYTGTDMTGSDLACSMKFAVDAGSDINARFDAFVMYDKQILFTNGACQEYD
jgi:hypothetical protein